MAKKIKTVDIPDEPGVVALLGALVVGDEIKPTGCRIKKSVLEKYGIDVEDLKARGLVK